MKADAISIVEAAYECEGDERTWFRRLLEQAAPKLDRGFGVTVSRYAPRMAPEESLVETLGMGAPLIDSANAMMSANPELADGTTKPIEEVTVGDRVLSYDTDRGETVAGEVVWLHVHPHTTRLVRLNDAITTTPEHRFYANGVWVPAGSLAVGDSFLHAPDQGAAATRLATELATSLSLFAGDTTTYNFEVATYHDYFAGGLLVHNMKFPQQN